MKMISYKALRVGLFTHPVKSHKELLRLSMLMMMLLTERRRLLVLRHTAAGSRKNPIKICCSKRDIWLDTKT